MTDLKGTCDLTALESRLYCEGNLKLVAIITVDGGLDENPLYEKALTCAINLFCRGDLDVLFLATNALAKSAFNRVDREMALLSEVSRVILPNEKKQNKKTNQTFGTHLDSRRKTIEQKRERKSFECVGKFLQVSGQAP